MSACQSMADLDVSAFVAAVCDSLVAGVTGRCGWVYVRPWSAENDAEADICLQAFRRRALQTFLDFACFGKELCYEKNVCGAGSGGPVVGLCGVSGAW